MYTIRMHHECEGEIENSVHRFTDWHCEACPVMAIGDQEGLIFLSHPNTSFFFLLSTKYHSSCWKNMKKASRKIVNTLRCDRVSSL